MTYFVDTNVLLYSRDTADPDKHEMAASWVEHLWETRRGRLSAQVLNEYYVSVTRKLKPGLPLEEARADVADLMAWQPVPVDASLISAALAIEDSAQLSFWDALIVAAAHRSECPYLLSEDLNDAQTIGTTTIVNPFTNPPPTDGDLKR